MNRDGGPRADASECGDGGVVYYRRHVALENLYILQQPTITQGQTIRFAAGFTFGGCDRFGGVEMRVETSYRQVKLYGYIWEAWGNLICPGGLAYGEEILMLTDLDVGTWTIQGIPPFTEPIPEATFEVLPCDGDCWCADPIPPVGYGESCTYGCNCEPGLSCVAYSGITGFEFHECYPSCSVWEDCPPGYSCDFMDDGPWGICSPQFVGPFPIECQSDPDCGENRRCQHTSEGGRICVADFDMNYDNRHCECHLDCGGLDCIKAEGEDVWWNECRLICRGDRDCPPGYYCDTPGSWDPPVCNPQWDSR